MEKSEIIPPIGNIAQARETPVSQTGQNFVEKELVPSPATALADVTDRGRSSLDKLLAVIPVDKQAEANGLILDLMKDARVNGEPIDPRISKINIGRGNKYRRSEREPKSDRA